MNQRAGHFLDETFQNQGNCKSAVQNIKIRAESSKVEEIKPL